MRRSEMELLMPGRFEDSGTAYAYQRTLFEEVAAGVRGPTISITPSTRHVGVTRRDTLRLGFDAAVLAAREEGYPVLVRGAGGGAIAAGPGTFGFSIIRPAVDARRSPKERYDEAAALVLRAFSRLDIEGAEVGEVRDEFCPGDHSIRAGATRKARSSSVSPSGSRRRPPASEASCWYGARRICSCVLSRVYACHEPPMRPGSVGSLRRTGSEAEVEDVTAALAEEAKTLYGAVPNPLDERTLQKARRDAWRL
jgi:lipoate-protein ligase A